MEVEKKPQVKMNLGSLERLGEGRLGGLCRACLSVAEPPSPLFSENENLADLIWRFAGVRPFQGDGLPEALCPRCCADLSTVSQFRERVQQADQLLQHYTKTLVKSEAEHTIKQEVVVGELTELANKRNHKKKKRLKTESPNDISTNVDIKSECNYEEEEDDDNDGVLIMDIPDDQKSDKSDPADAEDGKQKTKSFTCDVCQRPLSTKYSLKHHMKTRHSGKKKRVGNVTGWGAERRFHCVECTYSTRHGQSLVYHMRVHTGEKPYKCDVCDRCFSQPGSLSCHKKTHSDKMYFTCAECGKQFKYKETYEAHKNVHVSEKNYICTICNKGLKSRKTLEGHMNRHYNIKNYSCEMCGAMFVTSVELINHSKMHTGDKKYACNLCSFRTYMKKSLETHMRRHTGERPFKCDSCELSCYTKGELKCHKRKHTKEKNYSCPVCEMKFIHSSSVNKHMLKTHGIKYNRLNIVDRRIVK